VPRLLLVDDHALFRAGLQALLEDEHDITIVGEAGRGDEAVQLAAETQPDVVLLDLHLPDAHGASVCEDILEVSPASRVLILSAYDASEEVAAALIAGASGYILKTANADGLAHNIRSVARGEVLLASAAAKRIVERLSRLTEKPGRREEILDGLTAREREVFGLASQGLRNAAIASALFLSEKTIKTHLRNIYNKLGLASKSELRLYAARMGLLPASEDGT